MLLTWQKMYIDETFFVHLMKEKRATFEIMMKISNPKSYSMENDSLHQNSPKKAKFFSVFPIQ